MFEEQENNVVLNEKSVDRKPYINIESKSNELTIELYSCHDINMKFLVVVTPPSIYQILLIPFFSVIFVNVTPTKKISCHAYDIFSPS